MTTLVKRTTLIVRSLERSVAFYAGVLGLTRYYDDEIVLSGVGLAAGERGDRTRLVILRARDPVVGMIGLLEFTEPRLPEPAAPRTRLGIGDIVFVMQGDDVAGVHQRAHRHVASGAGEAVEPGGAGHAGTRSARAIAHAAPKPLSMPTTVMPLAHDACIASSAVTPSSPDP